MLNGLTNRFSRQGSPKDRGHQGMRERVLKNSQSALGGMRSGAHSQDSSEARHHGDRSVERLDWFLWFLMMTLLETEL